MKRLFSWLILLFLILAGTISFFFFQRKSPQQKPILYGVTVDDSWYQDTKLSTVIAALKDLPQRPTVRIVMSYDMAPKDYQKLFKEIDQVADIMACPVDSYEMKHYPDVKSYKKRFEESFQYLSQYTDIWEIGNEINGEDWLGKDSQLIANKMISAYQFIHEKGAKTALTAYYTKPKQQQVEMLDWLSRYVPSDMREHLDYLFVSYYEDDNEGYQPNWQSIFNQLEKQFPHSKLGIGECGNTKAHATTAQKKERYQHYYTMPRYTKNFVGGYFWWYFVQDSKEKIYKP